MMFYKRLFTTLGIKTKLRLLNLFIGAGFLLIILVTFTSFFTLRNLSLDITSREIQNVISGSEITRDLSKLSSDIDLLGLNFYGKNDYLEREGNRLKGAADRIAVKTDDPVLKNLITGLTARLGVFVSQCAVVNHLLLSRETIDYEMHGELDVLENLISDMLIDLTLAGDDTSYAEQLLALVMAYRESTLQIGALYAQLLMDEHFFIPHRENTCPLIAAIDSLLLRVLTITASRLDVARHGEKLVTHIANYREIIIRLHAEMMELGKRKISLRDQNLLTMSAMKTIEKRISESSQLTSEQIKKIVFLSGLIVTLLSAAIIIILVVTTTYLIRESISNPMNAILSQIKSFGKGDLKARITLDRGDEWADIEKGLNNMATDLLASYSSLEDSEKRFRELADLLPQPVFEIDTKGVLSYSNQRGYEIFGYNRENIQAGLGVAELFSAGDGSAIRKSLEKILRDGDHPMVSELSGLKKDGSRFPALVYMSKVTRGNKIFGARGIIVDITDYRRIEEALIQNERFLKSVIENIPNMIFVKDANDLRFVRFNRAGEELLGFSREELLGKTDYDFFPKKEADFFTTKDREVLAGKKSLDIPEETIETRKKGHRILHTKKIPILDKDNTSVYLLGISEDITDAIKVKEEKKQLELKLQMAKRMEAIGLMAGGVAHDLNNVLSGIVGYPDLILDQLPEDNMLRELIEEIKASGERAATIVADLLTVARGAAAQKERKNLNVLVREYLNSLECSRLLLQYPSVMCLQHFNAAQPFISCSTVHVKKCLMNLIINAVEAIEDKGTITISTENRHIDESSENPHHLKAGDYVILRVNDDGPGISKKDLDHIFEPFYTKKIMGRSGTGLGLTVVWNTMEDHGGKVILDSGPWGTCFTLYFPAKVEPADIRIERAETGSPMGNGERILVVDDNPSVLKLAGRMLLSLGYRSEMVPSGERAIEFVKKNPVDLIILDMVMDPGINGRQTYEAILKQVPGQKAIIASGFSESDDITATLQLGAGGFIKKPYTKHQLGRMIKEALTGR